MAGTRGQLSDDGLWEWSGAKWEHAPELPAQCHACNEIVQGRSDAKSFKCSHKHEFNFVVCSTCKGTTLRAKEDRDVVLRCPHCGASTQIPSVCRMWDWAADQAGRGAWPPGRVDTGDRRLAGLTLAAAGGSQLRPGLAYSIEFAAVSIRIASDSQIETVGYDAVRTLEIAEGPERSTSERNRDIAGAGLFGLMTGSQTRAVELRIVGTHSQYAFLSTQHTANALRQLLAPIEVRIRQAQPRASVGTASSVADELAKLAQLRDSGVLSDSEFASAKARLLG